VKVYEEQVLPRVIDVVLGTSQMLELRRRALRDVRGTVLELGFGSGTNLPAYPPAVTQVLAVDPSGTGFRLSAKRRSRSPIEVHYVGLDGEHLDLPDESVDAAVSTWTLCTIPDAAQALREVTRVLRPGGRLTFLEHGRSDDPRVARRQDRWNGLQRRVAGGCNLNRDMEQLVAASPLELEDLSRFTIVGPKALSSMYAGTAVKP
jgi:ubiquinone/menaquinone biosynthesis C-methylase UbiE